MKPFKSFRTFTLDEEVNPYAYTERAVFDVDDQSVRDNINTLLHGITAQCFLTPYIALERVAKVLANFHVHVPNMKFLEGTEGVEVFAIKQFGNKVGMRNDGEVVTKTDSPYSVYFEYRMNEKGLFDVFCEVVNSEELEDLISDMEDELNDEDITDTREDKLDEAAIKDKSLKAQMTAKDRRIKKAMKRIKGMTYLDHPEKSVLDPRGTGYKLKESKLEPKTSNARILQKALSAAKTKIKQLERSAYKVPNETKQPAKSMRLSHSFETDTERSLESEPLTKEKEDRIHHFGYMEEATSKKAAAKELAQKQRKEVTVRKGKLPDVMTTGKGRYTFTGTPEKSKLEGILKKAKERRKETKEITKAKKSEKPQALTPVQSTSSQQPQAKAPPKDVKPQPFDFDTHLHRYASTGHPEHKEAAIRAANADYASELSRLSKYPGSSGAQAHVNASWPKRCTEIV